MAALLPGAGRGKPAVAGPVVRVDAERHDRAGASLGGQGSDSRYLPAAIGVGNLSGTSLHQLRPVFSCGLVAVLSGARPWALDESDGQGWRTNLFIGGGFGDSDREACGPMDRFGSLCYARA